jgi:hypothetical protein
MAAHWGQTPHLDDPDTSVFLQSTDLTHSVGLAELTTLAGQWLRGGYPGCDEDRSLDLHS